MFKIDIFVHLCEKPVHNSSVITYIRVDKLRSYFITTPISVNVKGRFLHKKHKKRGFRYD